MDPFDGLVGGERVEEWVVVRSAFAVSGIDRDVAESRASTDTCSSTNFEHLN